MFGLATREDLEQASSKLFGGLSRVLTYVNRLSDTCKEISNTARENNRIMREIRQDQISFIVEQRTFNARMESRMTTFEEAVAQLNEVTNEWADRLETYEDTIQQLRDALANDAVEDAQQLAAQSAQHGAVISEIVARMRATGTDPEQPVTEEPLPDVEQPLPDGGGAVDGGGDQAEVPDNGGDASTDPATDDPTVDEASGDSADGEVPRFE